MTDIIAFDALERKVSKELATTVKTLRYLAERLEELPEHKVEEALPVAAWGILELERLAPWLREPQSTKKL